MRRALAIVAVLVVAGCQPTGAQPLTGAGTPAVTVTDLAGLRVAPAGAMAGYGRTQFGTAWQLDADHNGCRQRDDVLRRDLVNDVMQGRCVVLAGDLTDPYTGARVHFDKRADAGAVQIDHVVALGLAWRSGADRWTHDKRVEYANDLNNLLATERSVNASKSDDGADEWRPGRAYQCRYATVYVRTKTKWALTVTAPERAALVGMLGTCP